MEHYVTLFDGLFLPQGLALHASLERHAGSYTLWVLCVDDCAHDVLSRLALPNVRLLRLADWETPELLQVKPGRTRGEYCWTLTPFAPRFVFDADTSVQRVTYLDADVWLCATPGLLFREFDGSGKSVQITEHAYAPEHDQTATSGRFCVQFITFNRQSGELVRRWWADRCIEWCFARVEPGRFGDQMYLDDWPSRFADQVHVLQNKSLLQAPWNATRFAPSEAAAYHFHGLRLAAGGHVLLTENYQLPAATIRTHYEPYVKALASAVHRLRTVGHRSAPQVSGSAFQLLIRTYTKRVRGWWRNATVRAMLRLQ
jgi:hypothetical protein